MASEVERLRAALSKAADSLRYGGEKARTAKFAAVLFGAEMEARAVLAGSAPADDVRYDVMVGEVQRMAREVVEANRQRDAARAELADAKRAAIEAAMAVADKRAILPGDCEQLGPLDPETGVRDCAQERRDMTCWCEERAQEAEAIREGIRTLLPADPPPQPSRTMG